MGRRCCKQTLTWAQFGYLELLLGWQPRKQAQGLPAASLPAAMSRACQMRRTLTLHRGSDRIAWLAQRCEGLQGSVAVMASSLVAGGLRGFSSSAVAAAAPAVAAASKRGLLASLFSSGERVTVPLTDPLPGVEIPASAVSSAPAKTELTTLANGFKVATEDTPVGAHMHCCFAAEHCQR